MSSADTSEQQTNLDRPSRNEIERALKQKSSQRRSKPASHDHSKPSTTRRGQTVLGGDMSGIHSRRRKASWFRWLGGFGWINGIAAGIVVIILIAFFWPSPQNSVVEVAVENSVIESEPFYQESRIDVPEPTPDIEKSFSRDNDLPRATVYREQDFIESRTAELLEQAEEHLATGKYTQPPLANATDTYKDILKLDPRNVSAQQGLDYIAGRFLSTGMNSLQQGNLESAKLALQKISYVNRDSYEHGELSSAISGFEIQQQTTDLLQRASTAFAAEDYILPAQNNALFYYQEALKISPDNEEAASGVKSIADQYIALANTSALQGEYDAASGYLATVSVIDPSHSGIALIENIISRAKPLSQRAEQAQQESENQSTLRVAQANREDTPANRNNSISASSISENNVSLDRTPSLQAAEQAAFDRQYLDRGLSAYYAGDYQTASALLQPLADKGIARAQLRIAYMYFLGRGLDENKGEADRIVRAALPAIQKFATEGRTWAQSDLGSLYEDGLVLARDYKEAVFWYRSAAEQGYAGAQTNLGIMYARGLGVSTSRSTAIDWFEKAAAQGDAAAQRNLTALGAN
ncbi:MAG: tetratricopeptide repeat protein [Pseudomonadota bacterium]